jgi:hypothetical protein
VRRALSEEARALLRRLSLAPAGRWPLGAAVHTMVFAIFGIVIPLAKGLDFFDPVILAAYGFLTAVFAAPVVAHPFEHPSRRRVEARLTLAVLYGALMAIGALGTGILTVYWTHRNRAFFPPELAALAGAVGSGLALAYALASFAAWMTLRSTPKAARFALRGVMLGLLFLFWLRGRSLPDSLGPFTVLALAAVVVFRFALWRAVRPAPSS